MLIFDDVTPAPEPEQAPEWTLETRNPYQHVLDAHQAAQERQRQSNGLRVLNPANRYDHVLEQAGAGLLNGQSYQNQETP